MTAKTCPQCSTEFTPDRSTKRFCSSRCQKSAWQNERRRKDRINERRRKVRAYKNRDEELTRALDSIGGKISELMNDIQWDHDTPQKRQQLAEAQRRMKQLQRMQVEHRRAGG